MLAKYYTSLPAAVILGKLIQTVATMTAVIKVIRNQVTTMMVAVVTKTVTMGIRSIRMIAITTTAMTTVAPAVTLAITATTIAATTMARTTLNKSSIAILAATTQTAGKLNI